MHSNINDIFSTLAKGDTSLLEVLFDKPGGKKYLENLLLVFITAMPHVEEHKAELYDGCMTYLKKMERRITRQKEGERILQAVFQ